MENSNDQNLLFEEFKPVSTDEWEQLIHQDLKGADYDKKLIWNTLDGISVKPYYRSEDTDALAQHGYTGLFNHPAKQVANGNAWLIRQDLSYKGVAVTADKVQFLLSKGVESIGIHFDEAPQHDELMQLMAALPVEQAEFNFSGVNPGVLLDCLKEHCQSAGLDKKLIRGSLGFEPLADMMRTGRIHALDKQLDAAAEWIRQMGDFPHLRLIQVNGILFRQSGSTLVHEVGFALAVAVDYLNELSDRGLDVREVAPLITFKLAVGSNYFFEMAKFRAVRNLWAQVLESFSLHPGEINSWIHAESSAWNKTIYDPYVNLLRTSTEAMSAILGGADSLTVLPFNAIYQDTTAFSERLARNQQILLREEAFLDKVADPASGAYYIESLTDQISQKAWQVFQTVEKNGGFTDAFLDGYIQDAIVTIAQQRDLRVAQRKEILLGTNQYPNSAETVRDQVDYAKAFPGAINPEGADAQPLIPYRGAEEFELLRLATEKADKRPVVFLIPIGHPVMRKARASFASSFFGCAGYQIIDHPAGYSNLAHALEKAVEAKADLVVLCSSDEDYGTHGPAAAQSNLPFELIVAGYPADHMEELQKAGIRHFIHVRTNVLETLKGFNELLGIS